MTSTSRKPVIFEFDFETTDAVSSFAQNFEIVLIVGCGFMAGRRKREKERQRPTERRPEGWGRELCKKSLPECIWDPGDPRLAALQVLQKFLANENSAPWNKARFGEFLRT